MHEIIRNCFLFTALCAMVLLPNMAYSRSIADTVEQAVNSNPDIYAAYASERGVAGVVKERKSAFYPVFGVDASFERMRVSDFNTRTYTGGADNGYGGEGTLRVSQMVYDGRNVSNSYKAAQKRLKASKYDVTKQSTDIALSSILAHLNVLRMRELESMTSDYLKILDGYEASIQDMVDEGASDMSELLQAKEVKALTNNFLLDYQEQKQFTEAEYLQLVGDWPNDSMTISDADVAAGNSIPINIDDALVVVKKSHPMLMAAEYTVDALGYEVSAEEAHKLPRIDAEFSHFKRDQKENFGGEVEDTSALLRMTWNFELGGAQKARIVQKYQDKEQARLRMISIERELEKKLRQTMIRYKVSLERLKLQDKRKKTNAGIFKNYESQYEGGKRSLLELVNVRNQLYRAEVEYTNAYYSYYLAQFECLNASGLLQKALNIKVYQASADK